jgi:hypothetical protein
MSEKTQINLLIVETVMNHNYDYMKSPGFFYFMRSDGPSWWIKKDFR